MSELIKELRKCISSYNGGITAQDKCVEKRAADEIERLTAQRNELLSALKVFDALIEHQYCGTREAMSALQHAAFVAKDAIAKAEGKTTMHFDPRGVWRNE